MKYKKCSRCELNYVDLADSVCDICKRELKGERDYTAEDGICPICNRKSITPFDTVCERCLWKIKS